MKRLTAIGLALAAILNGCAFYMKKIRRAQAPSFGVR